MAEEHPVAGFVRANARSLYRTAFILTGNAHAAEELLQDTLTLLYPKWDQVAAAQAPLAYVRRALTNRFVSSRRPAAARDIAIWEIPDGWDGADLSESIVTSRRIWDLLGGLPERQRAAVVLRYLYDLPEDDIAAAIGCRPVTVRTLVRRGLGAMRTAYEHAALLDGPQGGGR